MRALACVALAFAGCASLVGIDDFEHDPLDVDPPDGRPPGDVPATLVVSGGAAVDNGDGPFPVFGSTPVSFVSADGAVVNGVTGSLGVFTLVVPAGAPVSGYVHVTTGPTTFQPRHYVFDLSGDLMNLFVDGYGLSRLDGIAAAGGTTQPQSTGCVLVRVRDPGTLQNVEGATIELGGTGIVRYHADATNLPNASITATESSGAAWVFQASGSVAVTARRGERSVTRTVEVPASTFVALDVLVSP